MTVIQLYDDVTLQIGPHSDQSSWIQIWKRFKNDYKDVSCMTKNLSERFRKIQDSEDRKEEGKSWNVEFIYVKSKIRLFDDKKECWNWLNFFCGIIHIFCISLDTDHFDVNVVRDTEISSWQFFSRISNTIILSCFFVFDSVCILLDLKRISNELWITTSFDEAEYICVV